MNDALPAGTRLRGGALLIEEPLRREGNALLYRAYDVPERREVLLLEFFPESATRNSREVLLPQGWTAQGWKIAQQKFASSCGQTLFQFEENNTLFCVQEYSRFNTPQPSPHATVVLGSSATHPHDVTTVDVESTLTSPPQTLREQLAAPIPSPAIWTPTNTPPKFSWSDILPDIIQGAKQGAIVGTIGGVLLGALASTIGEGDLVAGALRGLWALPIGTLAGALLAGLRALPSNAPQLATASARTREQQVQSTLSGAAKGALLGFALVPLLTLSALVSGAEISAGTMLRILLLCALTGSFAGAIVGFIRVMPRDRSRRN
jgi:hypothetical protein